MRQDKVRKERISKELFNLLWWINAFYAFTEVLAPAGELPEEPEAHSVDKRRKFYSFKTDHNAISFYTQYTTKSPNFCNSSQ